MHYLTLVHVHIDRDSQCTVVGADYPRTPARSAHKTDFAELNIDLIG